MLLHLATETEYDTTNTIQMPMGDQKINEELKKKIDNSIIEPVPNALTQSEIGSEDADGKSLRCMMSILDFIAYIKGHNVMYLWKIGCRKTKARHSVKLR